MIAMNSVNSLLLVTRRRGEGKEEEMRKCLYDSRRTEGLVRFDLHAVNRSHLPESLSLKADVFFRKTPAV